MYTELRDFHVTCHKCTEGWRWCRTVISSKSHSSMNYCLSVCVWEGLMEFMGDRTKVSDWQKENQMLLKHHLTKWRLVEQWQKTDDFGTYPHLPLRLSMNAHLKVNATIYKEVLVVHSICSIGRDASYE